jgi:cysteine desulfurase
MKMDRIYLDYAATTPVDPDVVRLMANYFENEFGNPSSIHSFGQNAETALSKARKSILELMNVKEADLIFTSGGTESDNLALRGYLTSAENLHNKKLLISPVEHPAIAVTCSSLEKLYDIKTELLRVDKYGIVDPTFLKDKIDANTLLVSIIWANNEIGTVNDIRSLGKICKGQGVPIHSDGVQAAAHLQVNWETLNIDLMSFGAHKFYGPKGVGGLIKKRSIKLNPQSTGGSQEENLRAGTQNVPLILGMAKAYELVNEGRKDRNLHLIHLRNMLIDGVLKAIPGSYLTGHPEKRLPNHASFVIEGVTGQDLVIGLDMAGFAVSSGSACKVGKPTPSQVLLAIGIPEELARGALRVTIGKNTTEDQVVAFFSALKILVHELRKKGQYK